MRGAYRNVPFTLSEVRPRQYYLEASYKGNKGVIYVRDGAIMSGLLSTDEQERKAARRRCYEIIKKTL